MNYIKKLPAPEELQKEYPLTEEEEKSREKKIKEVQNIIAGEDKRKLIIAGPCSADRQDAVLDYVQRLKYLSDRISDKILIVPRIYTGKPRTTADGYKGILHNPQANEYENLLQGLYAARRMHLEVIRKTGMFSADEMLYPEEMYYVSDLLCYMVVGARSVEDQGHRMVASDSSVPVGMKNPTGGSKLVLADSIKAAQKSHKLIYRGWEAETEGNPYAHGILRGYTDDSGKNYCNYHYIDLMELYKMVCQNNVSNKSVIIDCSHSNSNKVYDEQILIAKEVIDSCKSNQVIDSFVKGLMIESYIEDGCQMPGENIYGKSITDPCLGWKKTEKLLLNLYEKL